MRALRGIWLWLGREFERAVCALLLAAMTALGLANVAVRYATDWSLAATEELLTQGFVALTVFGAAVAARRGEHLAVTALADALPPRGRRAVFALSVALSALLLALSAWFAWRLVANQMGSGVRSYALGLPMWAYAAPLPLGFALILLRALQRAAEAWRGEPPTPPAPHG